MLCHLVGAPGKLAIYRARMVRSSFLIHLVDGTYGMDGMRGDAMIKGLPLSTVSPISLLGLVFLVYACNALEKPTTMIPTVEIADRTTRKAMPQTNIADPTLAPGMTSTPLPVPLVREFPSFNDPESVV
jgi:hypothetical protein